MQKFKLVIFIALFAFHNICAQEDFDLSDCLIYTMNNSPKLQAEKLSQKKETATLNEQKSAYLPQIDAFVNQPNPFVQFVSLTQNRTQSAVQTADGSRPGDAILICQTQGLPENIF